MHYETQPIIVEGVNHSGTRLIVEILSIFGSDGGDYQNTWNENKFFLDIHKKLIDKISPFGWTKTILNNNFISKYKDSGEFKEYIIERLKNELEENFPNFKKAPWHMKCPTLALFEKTWVETFPEAIYLINLRDHRKIAKSFMRRGKEASLAFKDGLRFCKIMEEKIFSVKKKNEVVIDFDNLHKDIYKIVDIFPYNIEQSKVDFALSKINYKSPLWNRKRKIDANLRNVRASLLHFVYTKGFLKE